MILGYFEGKVTEVILVRYDFVNKDGLSYSYTGGDQKGLSSATGSNVVLDKEMNLFAPVRVEP